MKKGICIVFLNKDRMAKILRELEPTGIRWSMGQRPTEYTAWYEDSEYTNHISLLIKPCDIFHENPFLSYDTNFKTVKNVAKEGYSIFLYR